MWVSGLTAALSAMPTSRLWAVGGSVSWPEKGSAPRAGAQSRRRDRPLVVLQLLGRARGSLRVPWGFCFVLFALQLSVCLWWHDYRRDGFPTLKFVVVIADLARHLLREEPFALSAAPTIWAGEPGHC